MATKDQMRRCLGGLVFIFLILVFCESVCASDGTQKEAGKSAFSATACEEIVKFVEGLKGKLDMWKQKNGTVDGGSVGIEVAVRPGRCEHWESDDEETTDEHVSSHKIPRKVLRAKPLTKQISLTKEELKEGFAKFEKTVKNTFDGNKTEYPIFVRSEVEKEECSSFVFLLILSHNKSS